jgi:S-DNA-T family DNA segregation ATPase FtsK/SpoIIIE
MLNLPTDGSPEARERRLSIHTTLTRLGIEAYVASEQEGPTTRTYVLQPGSSRVRTIRGIREDLAIGLGVAHVHVMTEGGVLRIQIPRKDREFPDSIEVASKFKTEDFEFIIGLNTLGEPVTCGLENLPHLLISGATGSGKSVAMHHIITSLMAKHDPNDLRFVLIDPKAVELSRYSGLPHLATHVITSPAEASLKLQEVAKVMEHRHNELLSKGLVSAYQDPTMSKIVVVIDEYADLRQMAKNTETIVLRLAQKARAAGIHLILATQRPSAKIITGDIKANFPSRLALKASSAIDSRVVLGSAGAEGLLGKGDALFSDNGNIIRLQVPYADGHHVDKLRAHFL